MTEQVYSESNNGTVEQPISQPIATLVPRPYAPQPYAPQPYPESPTMLATTRNKPPRRRNAAHKSAGRKRAAHYRNAGPTRPPTGGSKPKLELPPTLGQKLKQVGTTILGAVVTSAAGVAMTRIGFHPGWVSGVLGGTGLVGTAFASNPLTRAFFGGAMSAGGSQLALLSFQSAPPAAPPTQVAQLPAPQHKNADLGTLPPGALDAAFERARAALAVEHNPEEHTGY